MTRAQYRAVHKWIFIFMGAFILMWCLSGVLMVLPPQWFGESSRFSRPAVDYRNVTLSPADAIRRLEQHTGSEPDTRSINLMQIHYRLLYQIQTRHNQTHYIDGLTGEHFEFTPALAEDITRSIFAIKSPLIESTRLTEHDMSYPLGELPVYCVRFENNGASFFVKEKDGRVSRSTAAAKLRNIIMTLHVLEPVEHFTHSAKLRKNILVLTGTLTLLGAIIGYILTLPAGRKGKQTAG